ncbi:MAG: acylphosphatase [Euryarchaeota archaeon]|nr:acylphosphatase [Euryarchaeota archaeon]
MPRWRLVVSGRVQTAGYRAQVKNHALGLGVKGLVRNLDDGTVEIYCESTPKLLEEFKRSINVKGERSNYIMPSVKNITVYKEGSMGFGKAPKTFKPFDIDYQIKNIRPAECQMLERSEMGIIALGVVSSSIMAMRTDLKDGFKETKDGLSRVGKGVERVEGAVNSMHKDMNQRFDSLDEKYGAIGQRMGTIEDKTTALLTEIQKSTAALVEMTQKVGTLIDKKLAE